VVVREAEMYSPPQFIPTPHHVDVVVVHESEVVNHMPSETVVIVEHVIQPVVVVVEEHHGGFIS